MKRFIVFTVICGLILCGSVAAGNDHPVVPKSPQKASGLSALGTFIPAGLGLAVVASGGGGSENGGGGTAAMGAMIFLAGSIVGPGLGHGYAGNSGQFWTGVGLRTVGLGGATVAFALSWDNSDSKGAVAGFVGGVAIFAISAIHDIATADNSARHYNEKHGLSSVSVSPTYFPKHEALGISLSIGL